MAEYVFTTFGSTCGQTSFQSVNSHYLCKVLKHRCKVEDKEVVHKGSSIILVEEALLGALEGTRDQLVPGRVLSASPSTPSAVLGPCAGIWHPLQKKKKEAESIGTEGVPSFFILLLY